MRHATRPALYLALVLACLSLVSCKDKSEPEQPAPDASSVVMTTFYPTTYFAERIAGDAIEVRNPVPADADPIFWQPGDADLLAYQQADLIILNGAEFEKWVASAALPATRVVDSSSKLDGPLLTYETATHSHGPTGEHTHAGADGHTWIDPVNAMAQSRIILEALLDRFPEHAEAFRTNAEALMGDLASLDTRWRALAPRLREAALLASHPAYNYLARRYELEITNLDLDPEAPPDDEASQAIAAALADTRPDQPILLLWEGAPLEETVRRLTDAHAITSVWVSPAESEDPNADYLGVMRANLDRLEAALN